MKKLIFSLLLLQGSSAFASGGLSELLGLPDGISMHWNGSIIADNNYAITTTKAGKVVQYKKEDSIDIKTNREGAPTTVTYQDQNSSVISFVNLVPGSESATRCHATRMNIALRKEFKKCITVDKKTCAALLKLTGSKDFSEFSDKVDVCSKLADNEQKAQMRGVLSVEKSNAETMMKNLDMTWTDFSDSTTQNFLAHDKGAVDPSVNRQYSYLRWAGHMCGAEIFSQPGFQSPSRVNFERKGAQ